MIIENQHFKHIIFMLCSVTNIFKKAEHTVCNHSLPVWLSFHQNPDVHSSFHLVWACRLCISQRETIMMETSPWIHYYPLSLIKEALLFECNICFISVFQDHGPDPVHATARWQSHLTVTGWTEWAKRWLCVESDRKQRRCQCIEEFQRRLFL